MKQEYYDILIAALLHDIGKFKERAFGGAEHDRFPKNMEGLILPLREGGYYSHRHALWTYDVFENDLAGCALPSEFDWKRIKDLAAKHHIDGEGDEKLIARADRLSAASDRSEDTLYEMGGHLRKRMRAPFTRIKLSNALSGNFGYPLKTISAESIFPDAIGEESQSLQGEYRALWDKFLSHFNRACQKYRPSQGKDQFVHLIISHLQRYCWCIPSATNDRFCDISLYDHAVSTAAFALVLKILEEEKGMEEKPFVFFGGDISGIQQFIFQHHQKAFKGSSKIIRGRSLYIATISHAYVFALCKKLGIPPFVSLINAGGKFTLLLPNIPRVRQALDEWTKSADEWFFQKFHGDFTVVCDYSTEASEEDVKLSSFKDTIAKINYNLAIAKSQKFLRILKNGQCIIDVEYGEEELCKACGRYSPLSGLEESRCDACHAMFTAGSKMTRSPIIAFHEGKGDMEFFGGMALSIIDTAEAGEGKKPWALFSMDVSAHDELPFFLCNSYVPMSKYGTMTFEEIAEASLREHSSDLDERTRIRGSKFLGYVKIDVDSMGVIFSHGVQELSVSRYVTLSRMFHAFFNLYVPHLLQERYPDFYTVFSGGDDVFLIAPWDQILHFIDELERAFMRFVCNHPDVHFSTGVLIQKPSFPMSKAALLAEEKLEEAKQHGKNRISYFSLMDYTEMRRIHDLAHWLVKRNDSAESSINHSFLYRFLRYTRMAKKVKTARFGPSDLMYIPSLKYDVSRNIVKKEQGKIINTDEVARIEKEFTTYTTTRPDLLETAVKIALYTTRAHTREKEEVQ